MRHDSPNRPTLRPQLRSDGQSNRYWNSLRQRIFYVFTRSIGENLMDKLQEIYIYTLTPIGWGIVKMDDAPAYWCMGFASVLWHLMDYSGINCKETSPMPIESLMVLLSASFCTGMAVESLPVSMLPIPFWVLMV